MIKKRQNFFDNYFIKSGITAIFLALIIIPFELFSGNLKSSMKMPEKIALLELQLKNDNDKTREEMISSIKMMNEHILNIKEKENKNEQNIEKITQNINKIENIITRVETIIEKLIYSKGENK